MDIRTLPLDHLGLVSGVFDQLVIADLIDDRLPKKRGDGIAVAIEEIEKWGR